MKAGFIHVCFVLDKSGSMWGSESDVKGGFASVIKEQKALTDGSCSVSLFEFDGKVNEVYIGKDVNEIDETNLDYSPGGSTAMNDGICTAIDTIGKWLSDMPEDERPEKNLIVIMTDGEENSSKEFKIEQVKEKIKHQTEKYNWSFVYMGTDITDKTYANTIFEGATGCVSSFTSRDNHMANYSVINNASKCYRSMVSADLDTKYATMNCFLAAETDKLTSDFEDNLQKKVTV